MRAAQFLAPLLFGALGACGDSNTASTSDDGGAVCSPASSFPSVALTTVTGDKGNVRVEFRSAPEPTITAGQQCIEVVVRDATSGNTIDGLSVTMIPWMPAMQHGASITPVVTPLGEGRYVFTNVVLSMLGEWELQTHLSGEASDSVEPTFNVDQ